ncbi:hypothetical protein PM082_019847 [Marasmius tenuissimus]|nr:hypothetical protein PM082_019847 [Marasmius tenuissimus]
MRTRALEEAEKKALSHVDGRRDTESVDLPCEIQVLNLVGATSGEPRFFDLNHNCPPPELHCVIMDQSLVLSRIEEDWDGYEGALVDDNSIDSPVKFIKEKLQDLSSCSEQDFSQFFRSWKAAIDSSSQDTPHLLAFLLKGEYPRIPPYSQGYGATEELDPKDHFKPSSLQDSDRSILAKIAPFAKCYGFNIHLGQSQYHEFGILDTGEVDLDALYAADEEYDYGDPEQGTILTEYEAGDEYQEELTIEHVFSLHGIPMDLMARDVLGDNIRNIFVNGTYNDGMRKSEIEPYSQVDGGPYLSRDWTRKVLLVSPENSTRTSVTPRLSNHEWMTSELHQSKSVASLPKEKSMVEGVLAWIEKKTSEVDSRPPFDPAQYRGAARGLIDSACRWKDAKLLGRVVDACTRDTLAIIEGDRILAVYQAFGSDITKNAVIEASKKEPSLGIQIQHMESLLAAAHARHDTAFSLWCTEHLQSAFGKLPKLEAGAVNFVVKTAGSQPNPTQALRDIALSKLRPVTHTDAQMWKALLDGIHEETQSQILPFEPTALHQLILQCLQLIAAELSPYTTMKHSSYSQPIRLVKHIVDFIELCIQYDTTECPNAMAFFRRMKDGVRDEHDKDSSVKTQRSGNLAHEFYADLVKEFDTLIQSKPDYYSTKARNLLSTFFSDAVAVMLPHYKPQSHYADHSPPVKIACLYLNDPVQAILEWLASEQVGSNPRREIEIVGLAKKCTETFRERNLSSDVVEKSLNALASYLEARAQNLARTPSLIYRPAGYNDSRELMKSVVEFFVSTGKLEHARRVLNLVLGAQISPDYIAQGLVPFLDDLRSSNSLLSQRKLSLVDMAPYSEFAAEVVKRWLLRVLGSRPCPEIAVDDLKVGCECAVCKKHLAPILGGGHPGQRKFNVLVQLEERQHLEGKLEAMQRWGITYKLGPLRGVDALQIQRPVALNELIRWTKKQPEAQRLLESLGTDQEQRKIMGSHYQWAMDFIAGAQSSSPAAATSTSFEPLAPHASLPKRPLETASEGNSKRLRLS